MARIIPVSPQPGVDAAELAWKTLPIPIYVAILLSLSYSSRKKMPIPLSIFNIVLMACLFTGLSSVGIDRYVNLRPAISIAAPVESGPGMILSRTNNSIILLRESTNTRGSRVVSFPYQPLIYQEVPMGPNNSIIQLPPLPLGYESPWFIRSIEIDFVLSGINLMNLFKSNLFHFIIYAFSLIFMLSSLRFMLGFSRWPMANVFLGALVFRGLLAFEEFINSQSINSLIGTFLGESFPPHLISPLVFTALGLLVILYTLLVHIAKSGRKANV